MTALLPPEKQTVSKHLQAFVDKQYFSYSKNWVPSTNANLLIIISLQPDVGDLRYFAYIVKV